jgi:hypothetical protein
LGSLYLNQIEDKISQFVTYFVMPEQKIPFVKIGQAGFQLKQIHV